MQAQRSSLVFIHGFMGNASDWDDLRADLAEQETLAINVPPTECWQDTIQILADSIPENAVLVGYSMGARLALGVALAIQEKLRGLIFISGNPGLESDSEREQRWIADQQMAKRIQTENTRSFLEDWYQQGVFAQTPERIRNAEIVRKLSLDPTPWPKILLANSVSQQPNLWPQVRGLSIPILGIAGKEDEKYAKIAVRLVEESQSLQSRVEIVSDCGHIVHREQRDALANAIRNFP